MYISLLSFNLVLMLDNFVALSFIIVALLFLLVGFLVMFVRNRKLLAALQSEQEQHQKQCEYVSAQRKQLEEINRDLLDSLEYAQKIQGHLNSRPDEMQAFLPDSFVILIPRNVVSGDFYFGIRKGSQLLVLVADCTGHGVPGAIMSMICITSLENIIARHQFLRPAQILNELRDNIKSLLDNDEPGELQRDGMDATLIIFEDNSNIVSFAGAHNPLLIYRGEELIELKADKQPVGWHLVEQPFNESKVELQPGDMVYLFTDGFPDQFGGEHNKKYMLRPFKKLLQSISKLPCDQQKQVLEQTMFEWRLSNTVPQIDDITVLGFRFH